MLRKSTFPWVGSAASQKVQPSKKLAPSLVSTNVQGEETVGVGVPPGVEVGVGRLEVEPETIEETMMGFPPPDGTVDDD
jgi:hypothetical protein